MAITSASLLVRSALGLPAGFFARAAFFAGLAFFVGLRAPLGFAYSGAVLLSFLLAAFAVVTWITAFGRNIKWNLRAIKAIRRMPRAA
jgi:hypothetical protein